MSAAAETYLAGVNATVTIDGTSMEIEDGSYKCEYASDEMTNNKGGGFYEDVKTIRKASGTVKAVYKGANAPTFVEGSIYTQTIAVPGGPTITGPSRVNSIDYALTVKGGVKYSWAWTSQGTFTKS